MKTIIVLILCALLALVPWLIGMFIAWEVYGFWQPEREVTRMSMAGAFLGAFVLVGLKVIFDDA